MARRKQAAAEAAEMTPNEAAATPIPPTPPTAAEDVPTSPKAPERQWRANPFPIKTVNLDGYKLQLQESRPEQGPWQMQIKFGSGGREDMPPAEVLDFVKSLRKTVKNREGEEKEVQAYHFNQQDRAWGNSIEFDQPNTSREAAKKDFDEVVKRVAAARGSAPERSGGVPF